MSTNENSESEIDSHTSSELFYDKLAENEMDDLISSIYDLLEDYMKIEVLNMSKLDFHKDVVDYITHILFQGFQDADICTDDDYESLYDVVYTQCELWFENREGLYPPRCKDHIITNIHVCEYGLAEDFVREFLHEKIERLRKINEEIPKQRTPEWYKRRYNMMTASNLWQTFSSDAQKNRLIYDKCKPLDFGYTENKWINTDNSLHWGVKYEPLSTMVYQEMTGAKVEEFGCIQHSEYAFIGASPDGIVVNDCPLYGRMLEIKNIYNREMDGTPSEAYWVQMQIQLECCDLDACDFVETRFKEYESATDFYMETGTMKRGLILYFIPKDGTSNVPLYKYMPFDIPLTIDAMNDWIMNVKNENAEYAIFKKIYWYLDEIAMTTILRNEQWFATALPIIKHTWSIIEQERVSGYEHRAAKKRITNDVIVLDSQDGSTSQIIKNLPMNGKICLIKLDSSETM